MSRRPASLSRRLGDGAGIPFMGSLNPKSRPSPLLSVVLVLVISEIFAHLIFILKSVALANTYTECEFFLGGNFQGAFLIIGYVYHGSGGSSGNKLAFSKLEGGVSCSTEISQALPYLKKAYGDSMHKVLHVGPDSCAVVSKLSKEEDTEAWGLEPYDLDESDANCKSLIRRGIVRVADIKFPLPYKSKSFSLVIVSDALDYLSPRYLNKTLPELARVSSDGFVILSGYPGQRRVKVAEMSKFGRPTKLEENEVASKKFDLAAAKKAYQSSYRNQSQRSLELGTKAKEA
ncbi:hypothetical protein Tco_0868141 [Tanacetum coccineum]